MEVPIYSVSMAVGHLAKKYIKSVYGYGLRGAH